MEAFKGYVRGNYEYKEGLLVAHFKHSNLDFLKK